MFEHAICCVSPHILLVYEMARYEEAIADLTRAIEVNPEAARYYGQRSLVYLFADRLDLAQADEEMSDALRERGLE